ncbi:glycosyltransferase family 2 protein [Nocardioides sp. GXZ039]|uniref:glycosyltransferase family 2 protein n=1 Tax=Nocardioides sp. GXZ039 TaxID=3136018 RepID=UPI0030F44818
MFLTASTVKDSAENVAFFVAANLASGVDHMFVFLDDPDDTEQREVADALDENPHVTCLRTDTAGWWGGKRPAGLNVRQRTNANWARAVLEPFEWAEWLFHIDGDEVARLDRRALAAVPASQDAVWLPPFEAVSVWDAGRPTLFKRLLRDGELNLLRVLGTIEEPTNQHYFHGHVMGKSGVRPGSGLGLTLHDAVSQDGRKQERHEDPRLGVLHYDAPSGEEFVRKWTALAHAGPARYRASRAPSAQALRSLVTDDLPDDVRERYLRRIYEQTTADDVETLADLGFLLEIDPLEAPAQPRSLDDAQREALAGRVSELADRPKGSFFIDDPAKGKAKGKKGAAPGGSQRKPGRREQLKRLARRG